MPLYKRLESIRALLWSEVDSNWDWVLGRANHTGTDGPHTVEGQSARALTVKRGGSDGSILAVYQDADLIFDFRTDGITHNYPVPPLWNRDAGYAPGLNGMIFQWGLGSTGDSPHTFPIAFPNDAMGVQITRTTAVFQEVHVLTWTSTQFETASEDGSDRNFRWFAYGN